MDASNINAWFANQTTTDTPAPIVAPVAKPAKRPAAKVIAAPVVVQAPELTPAPVDNPKYTIEQHFHTKFEFDMWIVIPRDRVSKMQFKANARIAEQFDGWYSRRFGTSPGGYAFKTIEDAQDFADDLFDMDEG